MKNNIKKGKIIVTPRSLSKSGHPYLEKIREAGYEVIFPSPGKQPNEEQLIASMDGVVGYLAGVEPISAKVIENATDLKVISRNGVGLDNIDLDAAEKAKKKICKAIGANSRGVAELAFAHILAASRSLTTADSNLKSKNWKREKGIELKGRILGIIGCGKIGKLVARFGQAFGMRVIAYDPFPDLEFSPGGSFCYSTFNEVIKRSDVISLHCPPEKDRYVIDSEVIFSLKTGVILINTARAGLIDEEAIITALDNGKVKYLTIDAFAVEPPVDWKLVSHPRVIATPHIGGFTKESVDRATIDAVDNLLKAL